MNIAFCLTFDSVFLAHLSKLYIRTSGLALFCDNTQICKTPHSAAFYSKI